MAKTVRFTKMQGAGNDYIYVDTLLNDVANPAAAAVAWSSPHTGIGADGLVLIGCSRVPEADFTMRIFNADGLPLYLELQRRRLRGAHVRQRLALRGQVPL